VRDSEVQLKDFRLRLLRYKLSPEFSNFDFTIIELNDHFLDTVCVTLPEQSLFSHRPRLSLLLIYVGEQMPPSKSPNFQPRTLTNLM
jgi:hypothetical protein